MVIVTKEVDSAQLVQLRSAILDKLESIRHQKFDDKKIDRFSLAFRIFLLKYLNLNYEFTEEELLNELSKRHLSNELKERIMEIVNMMAEVKYENKKIDEPEFSRIFEEGLDIIGVATNGKADKQPSQIIGDTKSRGIFTIFQRLISRAPAGGHEIRILPPPPPKVTQKQVNPEEIALISQQVNEQGQPVKKGTAKPKKVIEGFPLAQEGTVRQRPAKEKGKLDLQNQGLKKRPVAKSLEPKSEDEGAKKVAGEGIKQILKEKYDEVAQLDEKRRKQIEEINQQIDEEKKLQEEARGQLELLSQEGAKRQSEKEEKTQRNKQRSRKGSLKKQQLEEDHRKSEDEESRKREELEKKYADLQNLDEERREQLEAIKSQVDEQKEAQEKAGVQLELISQKESERERYDEERNKRSTTLKKQRELEEKFMELQKLDEERREQLEAMKGQIDEQKEAQEKAGVQLELISQKESERERHDKEDSEEEKMEKNLEFPIQREKKLKSDYRAELLKIRFERELQREKENMLLDEKEMEEKELMWQHKIDLLKIKFGRESQKEKERLLLEEGRRKSIERGEEDKRRLDDKEKMEKGLMWRYRSDVLKQKLEKERKKISQFSHAKGYSNKRGIFANLILDANKSLLNKDKAAAKSLYKRARGVYDELDDREKRLVYQDLKSLYSKLVQ